MAQVAAMKAAKTADQQSRAEQEAIFSVCFDLLYFFRFFLLFWTFFGFFPTFQFFRI
jgi:hypothetical protein